MPSEKTKSVIPVERIAGSILLIRGEKVMLDEDLAKLYQVPTKVFNQAMSRSLDRFPDDFIFRLTKEEWEALKSQIVISNEGRGAVDGHRGHLRSKELRCSRAKALPVLLSTVLHNVIY